jgi:ABC-type spermidine/putrescine transport system permease subunit II
MALAGIALLCFVLMPVLVVAAVSVTSGDSFAIPSEGLSLRWYAEFVQDPEWRTAIANSVAIGMVSTAAALLLGVPAAYAAQRHSFPGKALVEALAISPLVLPTVAIAAAQYLVLAKLQLSGTMLAIIITHVVYVMPFVFIICGLGIAAVDPQIEAAAFSLGATRWTAFRRILLPNIYPSIMAASLLCFVSSFDELVLALFVGGGVRTVPLTILGELKYELKPTIAALSASLSLLTVGLAAIAILLMQRGRIKLGRLVS